MSVYPAQLRTHTAQVEGWDSDGNLVLEGGRRFCFQELTPQSHDFRARRLLRAVALQYRDGRWLVEGEDLIDWVEREAKRSTDARNEKRAAKGLPPVGLLDTHVDGTFQQFSSGDGIPDQADELRRLDADQRLLPYLILNQRLEELSVQQVGQCCGAAFFEGMPDPVLLRSFYAVRSVADDAQLLLRAAESTTKAVNGAAAHLKDVASPLRDIYNGPKMIAVRKSALHRGVPVQLLDVIMSMHHSEDFPTGPKLMKRVISMKGYTGPGSRSQISKHLAVVRVMMEEAGLKDPSRV